MQRFCSKQSYVTVSVKQHNGRLLPIAGLALERTAACSFRVVCSLNIFEAYVCGKYSVLIFTVFVTGVNSEHVF